MADFDNRLVRGAAAGDVSIDAGLRAYMLRVYNYMLIGLVVTGLTSMATYLASITADPAAAVRDLYEATRHAAIISGAALFTSPLRWVADASRHLANGAADPVLPPAEHELRHRAAPYLLGLSRRLMGVSLISVRFSSSTPRRALPRCSLSTPPRSAVSACGDCPPPKARPDEGFGSFPPSWASDRPDHGFADRQHLAAIQAPLRCGS